MFNPYHARPIGSDKFLNHMLALMTERDEIRKEELEAVPKIPVHPQKEHEEQPVYFDPIMDGYRALANAVLAQALIDYLEEYELRLRLEHEGRDDRAYVHECRCLTMENEYFRDDGDRSDLLDCILRYVIHNWKDEGKLQWRLDRIRGARTRLSKVVHNC